MKDGFLPLPTLFHQGVALGNQGVGSCCTSSILLWWDLEGGKDTCMHHAGYVFSP